MLSVFFFFSSRRRHTRCSRDWSSDVCSSDLHEQSRERNTTWHGHGDGHRNFGESHSLNFRLSHCPITEERPVAGPLAPLPPLCNGLTGGLMRRQLDELRSPAANLEASDTFDIFSHFVAPGLNSRIERGKTDEERRECVHEGQHPAFIFEEWNGGGGSNCGNRAAGRQNVGVRPGSWRRPRTNHQGGHRDSKVLASPRTGRRRPLETVRGTRRYPG